MVSDDEAAAGPSKRALRSLPGRPPLARKNAKMMDPDDDAIYRADPALDVEPLLKIKRKHSVPAKWTTTEPITFIQIDENGEKLVVEPPKQLPVQVNNGRGRPRRSFSVVPPLPAGLAASLRKIDENDMATVEPCKPVKPPKKVPVQMHNGRSQLRRSSTVVRPLPAQLAAPAPNGLAAVAASLRKIDENDVATVEPRKPVGPPKKVPLQINNGRCRLIRSCSVVRPLAPQLAALAPNKLSELAALAPNGLAELAKLAPNRVAELAKLPPAELAELAALGPNGLAAFAALLQKAPKAPPEVPDGPPARLEAAMVAMKNVSTVKKEWVEPVIEVKAVDVDEDNIDTFVMEHGDKDETHWNAVTESMVARKKEFAFEYIIACEPNQTPETLTNKGNAVLIMWTNFAVPTWTFIKNVNKKRGNSDQVNMFMRRLEILAHLEKRVTAKLEPEGKDFKTIFKYRWLARADDIDDYVTDPRAKYVNKLAAFEWRMNYEYKKEYELMGLSPPPKIYVVNWLDDAPVPGMDIPLDFIIRSKPSKRVAAVLANTQEMAWITCTSKCTQSCSFPKEHYSRMSPCCGVLYGSKLHYHSGKLVSTLADSEVDDPMRIVVADDNTPGKDTPLTTLEIEASFMVECVDTCVCAGILEEKDGAVKKTDKKKRRSQADISKPVSKVKKHCKQQVVQRGRQVSLIVFREGGKKGWGLRAGQVIGQNEFVTEYVGDILSEHEVPEGTHYSFAMRSGWAENVYATDRVDNLPPQSFKNTIRRHRPFSIDALYSGNESRFINHSCEPNLVATCVYVERHGEFYHRIAFFARRKILPGEELTFDYFPGAESIRMWRAMFNECGCETKSCKFIDYVDSEDEEERKEMRKDDDAVSVGSLDSFTEDNDEFLERDKRHKENRKKDERKGKARQEKEQTGAESVEKKQVKKKKEKRYNVSDLRRDPMEILKDRMGEEKAEQMMQARMNSRGILGKFAAKPFDAVEQAKMLKDAAESLARKRKEMMERKERLEKEKEAEEKENSDDDEMEFDTEAFKKMELEKRARKRKSTSTFEE